MKRCLLLVVALGGCPKDPPAQEPREPDEHHVPVRDLALEDCAQMFQVNRVCTELSDDTIGEMCVDVVDRTPEDRLFTIGDCDSDGDCDAFLVCLRPLGVWTSYDRDDDRVIDVCDVCPDDAEVFQGIADQDGCPDQSIDDFGASSPRPEYQNAPPPETCPDVLRYDP